MKAFIFVFVCCQLSCFCLSEQSYEVANEQIESFKGHKETLVDFSKLKTIKRERFINGSMTFLVDMDNDQYFFAVELYSSSSGNGNYKKMAMDVPKTGICAGFKDLYTKLIQPSLKYEGNTNFPVVPDDGLCPLPKGSYYVSNIIFNTDAWPSQVPRGIIKSVITFYKNDDVIGGVTIVVKISDKST